MSERWCWHPWAIVALVAVLAVAALVTLAILRHEPGAPEPKPDLAAEAAAICGGASNVLTYEAFEYGQPAIDNVECKP